MPRDLNLIFVFSQGLYTTESTHFSGPHPQDLLPGVFFKLAISEFKVGTVQIFL